jgi:hypothetical protein
MSDLRLKKQTSVFSILGIFILTVGVLTLCGCRHVAPTGERKPVSNNPPVVVTGGSIYGDSSRQAVTWSQASKCTGGATDQLEFCAPVKGGSNYLSSQLYNPSLNQTVPNTSNQSWKIFITDKDSHGNENPSEGVLLCGNSQCDPTKPSDLQHVYIRPYNEVNSRWEDTPSTTPSYYLYFHDKSEGCEPSYDPSHHSGNCEHPSTANLYIGSALTPISYPCSVPTGYGCTIGVGIPQFRGTD